MLDETADSNLIFFSFRLLVLRRRPGDVKICVPFIHSGVSASERKRSTLGPPECA